MVRVKGSTNKERVERIEQVFDLYRKGIYSHEAAAIVGRDISTIRRYYRILQPRMKTHRDKRWAATIRWINYRQEKKRLERRKQYALYQTHAILPI